MAELYERGLLEEASSMMNTFPVLKIHGARQVGKSTLAAMLVRDREAVFKSLDRDNLRELAESDPEFFVSVPDGSTLVVDEIQRLPKVSLAIKYSVDQNRVPGKFILAGSSDFMRVKGHKDSLAGRAAGIHVHPLSLMERLGQLGTSCFVDRVIDGLVVDGVTPKVPIGRREFADLVEKGGFPLVQDFDTRARKQWFAAYLNDVVGLDVLSENLTTYPERLNQVLRLLAAQQSQELVKATLAREADIPSSSVQNYVDILSRIYLLELIPAWSRNLVSRQKGKPKVHVVDTGLVAFLTGQDAQRWMDPSNPDPFFGQMVEGALMQEIVAQRGWAENRHEIYHWRDRDGREVDCVIELADGRVIALEFKSGSPKSKHFDHLKFFEEKLGDKFVGGYVVGSGTSVQQWGRKLFSVPWALLWF